MNFVRKKRGRGEMRDKKIRIETQCHWSLTLICTQRRVLIDDKIKHCMFYIVLIDISALLLQRNPMIV
jgi:hypothetical protein